MQIYKIIAILALILFLSGCHIIQSNLTLANEKFLENEQKWDKTQIQQPPEETSTPKKNSWFSKITQNGKSKATSTPEATIPPEVMLTPETTLPPEATSTTEDDSVESSPVEKFLSGIASEIEKLNEDFTLTIEGLTQADINNVELFKHFPELQDYNWSGTIYPDYAVLEVSIKISMEHKILSAYRSGNIELLSTEEQQVLDVALNIITSKISEDLSDYEKELIVHDYIIMNCAYDSVNYNKNTIPDTSRTSYGVLVLGVAVCDGYSRAFKLLMDMLDIECDIVTGWADGERHAWNRVKLDGDYYLVDVTWNDPTLEGNSNVEAHYNFFNLSDEAMNASHTPSEPQIKVANSTKYNYFYYNNLVVSSKNDFLKILQEALDKNENYVYVLYENFDLRKFIESNDMFQYLRGKSNISYSFSDKVNTVYLQFE